MITSPSTLLSMKNVTDNFCRENQNTHFMLSNSLLENRAVYLIKWKRIVEAGRPQMTISRMRIACRISKPANTQSVCVILISFPLQQCSRERASLLRYSYSACFVHAVNKALHARSQCCCTGPQPLQFQIMFCDIG